MRKRVLRTTKILAVALVATPACSKTEARPDPPPVSPAPVASAASVVREAGAEDPKLLPLRDELYATKRDAAFANVGHFRPLCDEDGYPLVGNLARKAADQGPPPSELCAEVRKIKLGR